MEQNILYSGAAVGADTEWDNCAVSAGHEAVHFVPSSNGRYSNIRGDLRVIDDGKASLAHQYVMKANKSLKRTYPTKNTYTNRLLQRNYYQINEVNTLYAVGTFNSNSEVDGGTAWAIQMFLDRINIDSNRTISMCPVYFYHLDKNIWYQAYLTLLMNNNNLKRSLGWFAIEKNNVPRPSGKYAGIGSRNITEEGRLAIADLYKS